MFKNSYHYIYLTKRDKRQLNYKHFIEKLQLNIFIAKYIKPDKDKVYIITYHKIKEVEIEVEEVKYNESAKIYDVCLAK